MTAAGTALVRAMDRVIDALRPLAAERLQANVTQIVFANGAFQAQGNTSTINLAAVMAGQTQPVTMDVFESAAGATFPNGCHICEVEIDPETGSVDLQYYIVVDDVGNVLNPMLVDGQNFGWYCTGSGAGADGTDRARSRHRSAFVGHLYGLRDAARRQPSQSADKQPSRCDFDEPFGGQGRG